MALVLFEGLIEEFLKVLCVLAVFSLFTDFDQEKRTKTSKFLHETQKTLFRLTEVLHDLIRDFSLLW